MNADEFSEYFSAEITLFWTTKGEDPTAQLIFAVTELIPENQLASDPLGGGKTPFLHLSIGNQSKTRICCRRFFCSVDQALDCYQRGDWSELQDAPKTLRMSEGLRREPVTGLALVLPRGQVIFGCDTSNLAEVIPNRPTSLRACAWMNSEETWNKSFTKGEHSKIVQYVKKLCGTDLNAFGEFWGASILCMQNPVLWGIKSYGKDDRGLLHLLLLPRDGKSPVGMRYMVRAKHSFGTVAAELGEVKSEIITVPWPTGGKESELYLWDQKGTLLELQILSYRDLSFHSTMEHWTLPDGTPVPIWPEENGRDKKKKTLMTQYEDRRWYQRLEERKEFFYFRAKEEKRADGVLHKLLPHARNITICDMYLTDDALKRVFQGWIKCRSLKIFVSKEWLGKDETEGAETLEGKAKEKNDEALKRRYSLLNKLETMYRGGEFRYGALYRLSGGPSDNGIIHDRYLILDEQAYCLGSSLKDFAARDTVLFRSPNPVAFDERINELISQMKKPFREWGDRNG